MAAQMRVDDIVTAFGATDAPLDTAVATNEGDKRSQDHKTLLCNIRFFGFIGVLLL